MWGSNLTPQLRLLKTNLSAFQLSIPRAEIETSATFKEAIRVTRCLGYRYLWIDSLCILQDSETDWEYEARRMAIVYGNAVCNLAFLFPPHSNNNCRARDDPRKWNPCILRSVTEGGCPGVYIEHIGSLFRQEFGHEEKTRPWLVQRDWPLFDRAWTFQEYLLSPRTLLLGHQNLMFQCSQLFHDELLGSLPDMQPTSNETPKRGKDRGKSRYFPPTIRELRSASSLSEPAVLSFMADWQNVINEYRSRRLSFAKDRVVAFAGIARAFANIGDLTYLAGAYKEIFPVCLLWYVDKKSPVRVRLENSLPQGVPLGDIWTSAITEPIEHAAPSWSWFSVPIYRYYQLHFLLGDDELFVRCKSYKNPELVCFNDIFWADLSSFQFESHPPEHVLESAFFEFTSLRVTLATLVLPVRENWPADLTAQMGILRTTSTSELDRDFNWDPVFTYYPDIPLGRKTPKQNAIYAVLAEFQVVRTAGKNNIQRRLAGLVLIPGPHAGTWTRVGVWKLRINVSNVAVESKNMAHVAERWRGLEMLSPKWVFALITIV
ncbi:HET-domain-containing protein [Clathrospora elynae]|uniref:HET-domain-containing protein n=1 Tax=Clathrospora elynae TaxID=706981 RepID=A0A6A5SVP8_9PLEO|nr:HET-domain-containing protein [Clathrospora elynae]